MPAGLNGSSDPRTGSGARLLRPLASLGMLALGALAATSAGGCEGELKKETGPDCFCSVSNVRTGESWQLLCGLRQCIAEEWFVCRAQDQPVNDGPCDPVEEPDAGAGDGGATDGGAIRPDGGPPTDGGGTVDAGPCPPGGGSCNRNTFVPCDRTQAPRSCHASLCVPSGAGPVAGCLALAGQSCRDVSCAPDRELICDPASRLCVVQPACEDECPSLEARSCLTDGRPAVCRRQAAAQGGCLAWQAEPACPGTQLCAEGRCQSWCEAGAPRCGGGEQCEERLPGCVSIGAGLNPPLTFCQTAADCLTPGAACFGNQCLAPCSSQEDCIVLGAGCCRPIGRYPVCQNAC